MKYFYLLLYNYDYLSISEEIQRVIKNFVLKRGTIIDVHSDFIQSDSFYELYYANN